MRRCASRRASRNESGTRATPTERGERSGAARVGAGLRALALAALIAAPLAGPARADDYDPERAGHPLRIVAYALHPIGVGLDYLLMRPAHWLAHHEPLRTLFGHEAD